MQVKIKALQAKHGDAIIVEITHPSSGVFRILIDGGPPGTMGKVNHPRVKATQASTLLSELDAYSRNNQSFDITVLTHIDDDHIGGILAAYRRDEYREVLGKQIWFNSARLIASQLNQAPANESRITISPIKGSETSVSQGVDLDDLIELHQKTRELISTDMPPKKYEWGTIHILSPTAVQIKNLHDYWVKEKPLSQTSGKECDYLKLITQLQCDDTFISDTSTRNASSIAMLIATAAGNMLFLGDAFSSTICKSLELLNFSKSNPLKVEVCKISHHGSKGNTCADFLSLVNVNHFLISTNGGKQLPDKQTIARIFKHAPNSKIVFNYPNLKEKIFTAEEIAYWNHNLPDFREIILQS
jgi:beta-lactamase superfamily II metal-dependent hydrolase